MGIKKLLVLNVKLLVSDFQLTMRHAYVIGHAYHVILFPPIGNDETPMSTNPECIYYNPSLN